MNITEDRNIIFQSIHNNPRIIGIDGIDGVGKTTLAKDIEKLGYKRISLDNFLIKKGGGYFKFIDYKRLVNTINNNGNSVIEGILLKKIINSISMKIDFYVYVTDTIWIYDWLEDYQGKYCNLTLDKIISNVEKEVNNLSKKISPGAKPYKMDEFRKEIYEYSCEYRPWEQADIILQI